mgnify:CR=1 FL=1
MGSLRHEQPLTDLYLLFCRNVLTLALVLGHYVSLFAIFLTLFCYFSVFSGYTVYRCLSILSLSLSLSLSLYVVSAQGYIFPSLALDVSILLVSFCMCLHAFYMTCCSPFCATSLFPYTYTHIYMHTHIHTHPHIYAYVYIYCKECRAKASIKTENRKERKTQV